MYLRILPLTQSNERCIFLTIYIGFYAFQDLLMSKAVKKIIKGLDPISVFKDSPHGKSYLF